tara:strand:+ start:443 stop:607 length:165 start_codon:yes stop_codon:yes gene_type:complete
MKVVMTAISLMRMLVFQTALKLVVAMVWFESISIQTMTLMSPATMAMHLIWMIV